MSGDVMEFPKTPEEFCEQYSFFDKNEVYTNGSLLIPVFRVEQMVEHYFERTCHMVTDESCQNWNSCDVCDSDYYTDQPINYCPNCGAKVVGE